MWPIIDLYCLACGMIGLVMHGRNDDENTMYRMLFASNFITISNSILAIKKLLCEGLDCQANILIRQLIEICMLLLNITIDKEKADVLKDINKSNENKNIWRKYFSPSALNKTIEKYEGTFLTEWRKEIYGWYSNYVHNNFLSMHIIMYAKNNNSEDLLKVNVWGSYVSRVNDILDNVIMVLWYTMKMFFYVLSDRNTFFDIKTLSTDKAQWREAAYIYLLADKLAEEYLLKNREYNT